MRLHFTGSWPKALAMIHEVSIFLEWIKKDVDAEEAVSIMRLLLTGNSGNKTLRTDKDNILKIFLKTRCWQQENALYNTRSLVETEAKEACRKSSLTTS